MCKYVKCSIACFAGCRKSVIRMDMFLSPAVPYFLKANSTSHKPFSLFRCIRKSRGNNGLSDSYFEMESKGHGSTGITQDTSESKKSVQEKKPNDVWELFKEAQQNILHLNKQRMMAIRELDKAKKETKILLDRIEELENEMLRKDGKDRIAISSELLLRIDSLVLTGMIDIREASELRRMIKDSGPIIAEDVSDIIQRTDAEFLAELRNFSAKRKRKGFHIVHICTEMAPAISIGSLASYVTGLSHALQRKGHLVEVILPKYSILNLDEVQGLRKIEAEFFSFFNGQLHVNRIWTGVVCGIGVTFIEPIHHSFFSHERVYGYSNDFERFAYFSRATLDYIVKSGKQPDVLHIHNWQTAIVAPLFWDLFVQQGLGSTRVLMTCHGFDSQCLEKPDKLALCGLDPSRLHRLDRFQDNMKTHLVNILKGGIVYSNKVVVMSSTRLEDCFRRSLSHGLEPTLSVHKNKLIVAPYGINSFTWDPSTDKLLPQNYSAKDMKGKAVCKIALQQHMGLSENAHMVIVGCILSEVSDIELENFKSLAQIASGKGVQFSFMVMNKTSSISRELEILLQELKDDNVRLFREYDEALTHLIFAGSDIVLCQSFDDPVLQVPLKAMRYGACPVKATIINNQLGQSTYHDSESTKFSQYISSTFGNLSLSQAIDEINSNRSHWDSKIINAMTKDFSWDAECYDVHESAYTAIKNL